MSQLGNIIESVNCMVIQLSINIIFILLEIYWISDDEPMCLFSIIVSQLTCTNKCNYLFSPKKLFWF